jgi:hypothetical protein
MAQQSLPSVLNPVALWKRVTTMLTELYAGATTPAQRTAVSALTPIATADATDLPSALVLVNANKAKINAVIAALNA